jgi:hypothetical protein
MSNGASPAAGPPVPPADRRRAGEWLIRHGLADGRPTPLLAARLAARRRARRADHLMLATLMIAAALAQAYDRLATAAALGWSAPRRATPLVVLIALIIVLLLIQSSFDWWVRRVDRRAGATLSRRAAHPVQPGWRAVLGRPYAAFVAATFAGSVVLAVSALAVGDSTVRYAALVLLAGLFGVAIGIALQLRDLLARPVVAEDEISLTADVIMRVEDARECTAPTVLWALPVVLLFGTAPGWWNAASLAFVLAGAVALSRIKARTPASATVARQAMIAQ